MWVPLTTGNTEWIKTEPMVDGGWFIVDWFVTPWFFLSNLWVPTPEVSGAWEVLPTSPTSPVWTTAPKVTTVWTK